MKFDFDGLIGLSGVSYPLITRYIVVQIWFLEANVCALLLAASDRIDNLMSLAIDLLISRVWRFQYLDSHEW